MGYNLLDALNVRVVGSGDRYLVLAHGFGTDQSVWQRILPLFTPSYRIILYDLVCAGSVNPDYFDFTRYTTLDPYVDDLFNILKALGVDRCAYVGHSVSAMIGILASIRRPQLFSKLILIGASPRCVFFTVELVLGILIELYGWDIKNAKLWFSRFLNDEDYHGGFEQGEIEKVFSAMEANYEAWVNGFAPLAVGADVPTAVREFSRTLFNMRPDISLFVSRTVFNSDLRGVLGLVRVPCCVIQTSRDVSVPASVADYFRTHLGGRTTVEILRTEGHLPHLTAPALLSQVIRRALSR
ncbi:putative strigolactone esterase DAD2 [Hibiscus syriacus]|uniref:Strigolactone esterase DAD2 n=1 Tax=Hibiscus syriacus TaxID=106335 RepID=A0A6A3CWN6_HIBSY|nr:putative strigolactone esterase DAD2 [Hibiscus syriacus]